MLVRAIRPAMSLTLLFDNSMYCSAAIAPRGETSLIWLLARFKYWMFFRSASGARFEIWFFERSREARLLHFSSPARSLICMPDPLMVERLATSASLIGLSLSRFSKTNLRTAASKFLSGKIERSVLLVLGASVLLV